MGRDNKKSRIERGYSFSEPFGAETHVGENKEEKKEPEKRVPLSQLFRYADWVDILFMVVGSISAAAHGVIFPSFALIMGKLVNAFSDPPDQIYNDISQLSTYFVYIGIGALVVTYFQNALWNHTAERQISRIRAAYLNALLRKNVAWFDSQDSGELTARIAGDTVVIQEGLGGDSLAKAIQFACQTIAGLIIGFTKGWRLALVILAVSPLLAAGGFFIVKTMASFTTKGQTAYAQAGGVATEVISSIRTVASFSGESREEERYGVQLKVAKMVGIRRGFISGFGIGFTLFILFGTYGLALWYGGQLVIQNLMSGGDVLTTFFSVLIGAFALGQVGPSLEKMSKGQVELPSVPFDWFKGAAFTIYQTIDTPSEIDPLSKEGDVPSGIEGYIKIKKVSFNYPTRPEAQIFDGLSLKIKPGQTVALVGPSGAGKSSVVSLVQRFYDPLEGSITLDGRDLKTLNLKWLRQQIGLVSQEPVLFSGTIAENIAYGKENATQEEIEAAAKSANAHNFITSFPDGYNTKVGEKGAQMSGGQKQRVAIARAIVKNPRILLLDEATSALDTESERIVQEALDSVKEGRTTIVIAHRLTTVRNADVIAVISKGKVAEKGTHDELLAQNGLYADLVKAQAQGLDGEEKKKKKSSQAKKTELSNGEEVEIVVKKGTEKDEAPSDVSLWRIAKLNKPEAGYILGACVAAIFNGGMNPVFAIVFSQMISLYYDSNDKIQTDSKMWAGIFVAIGAIPLIFNSLQSVMFTIAGENLTERIRKMTFHAILRQNIAWFDKEENSTGVLTSRLAREATLLEGLVGTRLALTVQNIVTVTAGLVIAFIYGWKLTLVILACSPLIAFANAIQMTSMKGFGKASKEANEASNQIATEAVGNIRTVASFTQESRILRQFDILLEKPTRIGIKRAHMTGFLAGLGELFMFGTNALGFWYGGKLTSVGEMDLNSFLKVFMAILLSAQSVGQTASFAPDAGKAKEAAAVLFKIIDHVPEIDSFSDEGEQPESIVGKLELRNVDFEYPTRPDAKVFQGMSLTAEPGKVLALVGQSGSGKSSTVALLERFYDVPSGEVLIDGRNIKSLNLKWLRKHVGMVGQEPVLFSGTIEDNIRYGKPDATKEEIENAAKASNAHKFITEFPNGYKTEVGEKGTQMSGGQKQRIAIARAIVKNPKILLLDEATSALDAESEKIVQAALDSVMQGRTTIVVAHRLSTIKNADVIAVIENGKVVERGSHDELIALNGTYFKLVQRQTQ